MGARHSNIVLSLLTSFSRWNHYLVLLVPEIFPLFREKCEATGPEPTQNMSFRRGRHISQNSIKRHLNFFVQLGLGLSAMSTVVIVRVLGVSGGENGFTCAKRRLNGSLMHLAAGVLNSFRLLALRSPLLVTRMWNGNIAKFRMPYSIVNLYQSTNSSGSSNRLFALRQTHDAASHQPRKPVFMALFERDETFVGRKDILDSI